MKKKWMAYILTIAMAASMIGCGSQKETTAAETKEETTAAETAAAETEAAESTSAETAEAASNAGPGTLTLVDDLGMEIVLTSVPGSVVSLSPACTEILFAVGAGDCVVGRTDFCTYPEEAAAVESIGSYVSPNTELILSLSPDVVFASDYVDDAIRSQLENAGIAVIVLSANSLEAVEKDILMVGQVMEMNENAEAVVAQMEEELAALTGICEKNDSPKTAFVDVGSFYSAGPGSLLDDVLNHIGVENIAADTGETWPQLSVEAIIEKNPDVYISLFPSVEEIKATAGLSDLDCVQNDQIICIDGYSAEGDMIQRPGPRLVQGMRLLAEMVYPELFQ